MIGVNVTVPSIVIKSRSINIIRSIVSFEAWNFITILSLKDVLKDERKKGI